MTLLQQVLARGIQLVSGRAMRPPKAYSSFAPEIAPPQRVVVPTDEGPVTVYLYRPPAQALADGSVPPVYINLHGGGFLIRRPEFDAHLCRTIAAEAGCVVVNVDYDVAPQRTYPVAPRQAYAVACWAAGAGAQEHGWDGDRLAIGGQSAGGNLAAGACLRARDEGGFTAQLQVLAYPPLDLALDPARKHARTAKPMISPGLAKLFNATYLVEAGRATEPLASPLLADDLSGVAPAVVVTADFDLLRDEGDAYAARLAEADVPVVHWVAPGVDHAFTHVEPVSHTREMLDLVVANLISAWSPREAGSSGHTPG